MEEGDREEPAIETFGSTGRGRVVESVHACMRHRDGDGLELMDRLLTMGTAGGCPAHVSVRLRLPCLLSVDRRLIDWPMLDSLGDIRRLRGGAAPLLNPSSCLVALHDDSHNPLPGP